MAIELLTLTRLWGNGISWENACFVKLRTRNASKTAIEHNAVSKVIDSMMVLSEFGGHKVCAVLF